MKQLYSLVFILFLSLSLYGQNKGTYFQQEVNSIIQAKLDDKNHKLYAEIQIEYINNSPDTLHFIYMHLWPNAYSNNNTAFAKQQLDFGKTDFHFTSDANRGFIDSLLFKVNNEKINWSFYKDNPDIALIFPNKLVLPGDTILITTPFRLKFPHSSFSRLGHNKQAYHATQWYPKPAVYDRNGWHPMPYLSIGEYYSEFGTFDVYLTLPENYIVAASGELQTASERIFLDSIAGFWNNAVETYSLPNRNSFPESSENYKTIHYRIKNAHDFAWIADKRFYVISESVKLPGHESEIVNYAFFVSDSQLWQNAVTYINRSLLFMSEKVGPYAYPSFSAVQIQNSGGANMEYPGLTTIDDKQSSFALDRVITHEVIHNWFYGALGFNERAHPWLDEGFTTYYDNRYIEKYYPERKLLAEIANTEIAKYFDLNHYANKKAQHLVILLLARLNIDLPASLHTEEYDMANYFAMIYYKAAISIKHLEKYLGTKEFDRIMQSFYNNWKIKHPYPEDLREHFEKESGKELSWFFDDLISSNKRLDYKIIRYNKTEEAYSVIVKNAGEIAAPVPVSAIKNDEVVATIWIEGFFGIKEVVFPIDNYCRFTIDPEHYTLDYKRRNNTIHVNKLFPRIQPMELQPYLSIENPLKTQVFASPLIGWNKNNGIMPGVALYNQTIPFNTYELFIMPMYGFENNRLSGRAWAYKTFFNRSRKPFHSIRFGADFKSFGTYAPAWSDNNEYYYRIAPSFEIKFNKSISPGQLENKLRYRFIHINRPNPIIAFPEFPFDNDPRHEANFMELSYHQSKENALNNYHFNAKLLHGDGNTKGTAELSFSFIYDRNKNRVNFRLFAGSFLRNTNNYPIDYRLRLSSQNGSKDYLFDNAYLGRDFRPGTFYGNQIYQNGGGFRMYTAVGQTSEWLAAVNITADLPFVPLQVFADIGTYAGAEDAFPGSETFPYVAGIAIEPIPNILSVNFPLFMSSDIERAADFMYDKYWQKVTFTLRLNALNPFNELRNITKYLY